MEVIINNIINFAYSLIDTWGPFIGIIVIILESIIPIIPLAAFIVLNIHIYGPVLGYIISWGATVVGCMFSFILFRKYFHNYVNKKLGKKKQYQKLIKWISKVKFSYLVLVIAMPFTPAFAVNISAGLSDITKKKFFFALLVGKPFMIYFWGYVGHNLIEMLTNPRAFLDVAGLLLGAYLLSVIVDKKLKIK